MKTIPVIKSEEFHFFLESASEKISSGPLSEHDLLCLRREMLEWLNKLLSIDVGAEEGIGEYPEVEMKKIMSITQFITDPLQEKNITLELESRNDYINKCRDNIREVSGGDWNPSRKATKRFLIAYWVFLAICMFVTFVEARNFKG